MSDEASDEDRNVIGEGEATLAKFVGLLAGYYAISGTVVLFLLLRPLNLVQPLLDALGPLRTVGLVILAAGFLFINVVMVGFLIMNAGKVESILN